MELARYVFFFQFYSFGQGAPERLLLILQGKS